MNKNLFIILGLAILLVGGVFWLQQSQQKPVVPIVEQPTQISQKPENKPRFVTEVDPDVSHWQIKETVFFTIKFPKEWYWMESDLEKTDYRSSVITNNPEFPIDKYADITFGIFGEYPLVLSNDTEIVASFGGTATANSDTPEQSINSGLRSIQEQFPSAECHRLSTSGKIPVRATCSYTVNDHQRIQVYFIVNKLNNIALAFRTTETSTVSKDTLDKIAASMVVKETW